MLDVTETGSVLPGFYDDLAASLEEARSLLAEGANSRHCAAHTPVVATIGCDGIPAQRVMILRAMDWNARSLRFHTDPRSHKTAEIITNGAASVLVYDPGPKIQLRLSGVAQIETDGADVDQAWQESTLFARRCYLSEAGPGTAVGQPVSGLPSWVEGRSPVESEIGSARANFAILRFNFARIEWLYLANAGHRRAIWNWDSVAGQWQGSWLIP